MASAVDIQGVVFKGGSCTLLARVVGEDAQPIVQADIASAEYTVYLLDENDPDSDTAVSGHTRVSVEVGSLIYNDLQTDELWDVDSTGYNLKHVLDVSSNSAFTIAGRSYRVIFTLTPVIGQTILVRFRLGAI